MKKIMIFDMIIWSKFKLAQPQPLFPVRVGCGFNPTRPNPQILRVRINPRRPLVQVACSSRVNEAKAGPGWTTATADAYKRFLRIK